MRADIEAHSSHQVKCRLSVKGVSVNTARDWVSPWLCLLALDWVQSVQVFSRVIPEPWEIIYFKLYKSQIAVIEQALETAALMLGSDRSFAVLAVCEALFSHQRAISRATFQQYRVLSLPERRTPRRYLSQLL